MDSSLLILCDQLFCVRIVLPWLVGKYNQDTPLYTQHENTMWLCNPFPETQDGYTIYRMAFTLQRWVSAKYNLPTSIILLCILFGIVTRSKYYMASHKLQVKQININFLFPKFLLRVFFPHTSYLFLHLSGLGHASLQKPRAKRS